MTKLEKVIKGIECCHNIQCASCPYYNYGKTVNDCVPVLWTDALELLKAQQPTVDAVPVVRCKDCKRHSTGYCRLGHVNDGQNWFCADGEKEGQE